MEADKGNIAADLCDLVADLYADRDSNLDQSVLRLTTVLWRLAFAQTRIQIWTRVRLTR